MSLKGKDRIRNIMAYAGMNGKDAACSQFGITQETFSRYVRKLKEKPKTEEETRPNILIFDIETAPTSAYVFKIWKENVPIDFISAPWYMLSWSAKWLFEDEVFSRVLTPEESIANNDERIIRDLWQFIDHADILIGHNIVKFDTPKANTRYIKYDIQPPSPFRQIDTLYEARKSFYLESNKLDYLARFLGLDGKLKHEGATMWTKCMAGDADALRMMDEYNRQDILTTEEVYLRLRPWIKNHPNMALYYNDDLTRCRNCGSTDLNFNTGDFYYTSLNKYSTVKCNQCGTPYMRARSTALNKIKNKSLLAPCPV